MCLSVLFSRVSVHCVCVPDVQRVMDLWEVELRLLVSHHVGVGDRTPVLDKNSTCS